MSQPVLLECSTCLATIALPLDVLPSKCRRQIPEGGGCGGDLRRHEPTNDMGKPEPVPAAAAPKPRRTRAPAPSVARSLLAVVDGERKHKDVTRAWDALERAFDRAGDTDSVATLRAHREKHKPNTKQSGPWARAEEPGGPLVWFDPTVDLSDDLIVGGELHTSLERLASELATLDTFIAAGIDPPTRVLFVGPSGVGKTLAVRWLGWKLGLPVAVIALSRVVSEYLGATSARFTKAVADAAAVPSILFVDEIDAVSGKRSAGGDKGADHEFSRVTTNLLQQLDWAPPSQIIVAATNLPDALDDALLRRLPDVVSFTIPTRDARERMIARWLARAPVSPAIRAQLVEETEGMSGAHLRARAMAAGRAALRAAMEATS